TAKTALVAYFKDHKIDPNPAQETTSKKRGAKSPSLSIHDLSKLIDAFAPMNHFVATMLRFLFSASYLGCFRISEVLSLKSCDVDFSKTGDERFVSVRLRWHKKASVEKDCQIYHLLNEASYPCLRVCDFYEEYVKLVRLTIHNIPNGAYVFPQTTAINGGLRVDWFKQAEQMRLRRILTNTVEATPGLPLGITLHSMRRGGAFYRVFESPERQFNFRELMAWCRWEDIKTCCEYLVTKNISDAIDPRLLLHKRSTNQFVVAGDQLASTVDIEALADTIIRAILEALPTQNVKPKTPVQKTMHEYLAPKAIPTARNGEEAWQQWFTPDPQNGLFIALKDFPKDSVKLDRRKYSERLTLSTTFAKFQCYDQFERAYDGFTRTYSGLLKEVRKRKREGTL
ncbi:unnamed protein product, partial [Aphanomyces euteiches]